MQASSSSPRKIAILFRYGAAEHVDFLPALPSMVRRLREKGWEVHHFGFRGASKQRETQAVEGLISHAGPFRVRRRSSPDKWIKAGLWLLYLPWLGRRLQREGFDWVFVDETLPLSAGGLRLGFKRKLAFTVHDFFTEIYLMPHAVCRPLARWMQKRDEKAWRTLDRVFVRVAPAKIALTHKGLNPDRITVAPDSVNLERFYPAEDSRESNRLRRHYGIGEGEVVMVHHGILHPNKGNVRLVHALFRLRHRLPDLKLLIIGEGEEKRQVEQTAHTRGIADRVILTGWLPGLEDIAGLLRVCDIGLVMRKGLPGDHFHVTSTLVHNLASGLPILAARLDGVASVLGEGEGVLFDPECGEEFDRELVRLVQSPSLRKRMGERARRRAEKVFGPDRISEVYVDALLYDPD